MAGARQEDRSVSQQQKSQLNASYHVPLTPGVPLMLTLDPTSQNYKYFQINDSASSDVQVAYKDGRPLKATLTQLISQSSQVKRYELGKLTADVTTPGQHAVKRDLRVALAPYQSGGPGDSPEQASERRKQTLSYLNDQIFLQAYPGQTINAWIPDGPPDRAVG